MFSFVPHLFEQCHINNDYSVPNFFWQDLGQFWQNFPKNKQDPPTPAYSALRVISISCPCNVIQYVCLNSIFPE